MKRLSISIIVLLIALTACRSVSDCPPEGYWDCRATQTAEALTATEFVRTDVPTDTPQPSPTATATEIVRTTVPTEVPTPTLEPSPTIRPTPTRLVPLGVNLLTNPGFEGAFYDEFVNNEDGGEFHTVAAGWHVFYCGLHYTPEPCPAPYAGDKNPADLLMRRPEYKPTALAARVNGGQQAQQFFCFFGTCEAGVYQVVETEVGVLYEVGAYFQSWANYAGDSASDFDNPDDVLNTEFLIRVNLSGDGFAFASENIECGRWLAWDVDGYDRYVKLSCEFVANSSQTTIFLGAVRNFPIANNDTYIDDAYVIAVDFATPTPIATASTPAATPLGGDCAIGAPVAWTLTTHFAMIVRDAPAGTDTGQRTSAGASYPISCIYSANDGDRWGLIYAGWVAVNLDGAIYGSLTP